jgi:hypothetical protein
MNIHDEMSMIDIVIYHQVRSIIMNIHDEMDMIEIVI